MEDFNDMSKQRMRCRIDFVVDKFQIDENTGFASFNLIPDPRRYEWITKGGIQYLHDKMDNSLFGLDVVKDLAAQLAGQPIYFQPPRIDDVKLYLESRIPIIDASLQGKGPEIQLSDPSAEFLDGLTKSTLGFAIMCVDIAGSTKIAQTLNSGTYARLISSLLSEISQIVYGFRGHILKYTGDGVISYFPEPNLITMNDLAFECSCALKTFMEKIFNPISHKLEFPTIEIRIGIDSGQANVIALGSPLTKRQTDIIGRVVSIAAKIQALGSPGDILVGEAARRLVHGMWREGLEEIALSDGWPYKTEAGIPYKVFRLKNDFTPKSLATIST